MRRNDRQISDIHEIKKILKECKVMRVAFCDGSVPYIVPMNFGWEICDGKYIFCFHCAKEGRKLELIEKNPTVCLETDCGHCLVEASDPCGYGYLYKSIIAVGKAEIVKEKDEKAYYLQLLMSQQTGESFTFTEPQTDTVCVFKVTCDWLTAKARKI